MPSSGAHCHSSRGRAFGNATRASAATAHHVRLDSSNRRRIAAADDVREELRLALLFAMRMDGDFDKRMQSWLRPIVICQCH